MARGRDCVDGVGVSWSLTNIALMRREKTVGKVGNMSALSTCITRHIKKNLELSRICTPIIISSPKKKSKLLCVTNWKGIGKVSFKNKPPKNCREKSLTWLALISSLLPVKLQDCQFYLWPSFCAPLAYTASSSRMPVCNV